MSDPDATRVSWTAVCARRLQRHHLAKPAAGAKPAEVVAAMCGAHAQVLTAAEWSIGLRIAGLPREAVHDALWTEHTLVKTFGPRGTVHLLPTHELPMWLGALAALPQSDNGLPPEARMTPEQTEAVIEAIADALENAELTPDELDAEVVARAGRWAGDRVVPAWYEHLPRWRPAVYQAAHRGVLCFGPNKGRKITYTSPRRWLPGLEPLGEATALAEVVRRYLYAYGPATSNHFARWLGVPPQWAAQLFDSLAEALHPVDLDGTWAWLAAGDTDMPAAHPGGVRLLPYFDAYAVGSHPRDRLYPGPAAERALSGGQAGNFPVLLVDGVVAGVWHQRKKGRKIDVTVEPLHPLTAGRRRELDEQVQRLGEFLSGNPALMIGTVSVGGHA
jgi:Winged helix DNA-binding domain